MLPNPAGQRFRQFELVAATGAGDRAMAGFEGIRSFVEVICHARMVLEIGCAVNVCYCMNHDFPVMFEELFSENGMSLERLRTFCEIAEAGGVTRAAQGAVRQSQYSRQLRELESYFGAELFLRKRNAFRPTQAGKKLLNIAKEFMSALESTRREIRRMPGRVCFGAGESLFNWLLFPKLCRIQELFPESRLEFRNLRSQDIIRALQESELDFGIVRRDACPSDLRQTRLGRISYRLYVPNGLYARVRKKPEADLLKHLPLAMLEGEGQFKARLQEASTKQRVSLNLRVVCSSFPLMTEVLKQEQVAAILPNIAEAVLPKTKFECLKLKMLRTMDREYVLCYRERTLERRISLARHLPALTNLLQIESRSDQSDSFGSEPDNPQSRSSTPKRAAPKIAPRTD